MLDAAVAGRADDAPHQLGADAVLLQRPLDREGGFRFPPPGVAQLLKLSGSMHLAVDKIAVGDAAHVGHTGRIVLDEAVGDAVREAHAAAALVEA